MIRAQDCTQHRRFGALAFLLVAYFFYAWSWNTVDILAPYIKESLGLTDLQAGSSYTLQSIGAILGAVVMGQVADKIGRRNALGDFDDRLRDGFGRAPVMSLASVSFLAAALVWFRMPETVNRRV